MSFVEHYICLVGWDINYAEFVEGKDCGSFLQQRFAYCICKSYANLDGFKFVNKI